MEINLGIDSEGRCHGIIVHAISRKYFRVSSFNDSDVAIALDLDCHPWLVSNHSEPAKLPISEPIKDISVAHSHIAMISVDNNVWFYSELLFPINREMNLVKESDNLYRLVGIAQIENIFLGARRKFLPFSRELKQVLVYIIHKQYHGLQLSIYEFSSNQTQIEELSMIPLPMNPAMIICHSNSNERYLLDDNQQLWYRDQSGNLDLIAKDIQQISQCNDIFFAISNYTLHQCKRDQLEKIMITNDNIVDIVVIVSRELQRSRLVLIDSDYNSTIYDVHNGTLVHSQDYVNNDIVLVPGQNLHPR